jgi:hypothetical protein
VPPAQRPRFYLVIGEYQGTPAHLESARQDQTGALYSPPESYRNCSREVRPRPHAGPASVQQWRRLPGTALRFRVSRRFKVSARHVHRRNRFAADLRRDFPRGKKKRA